MKKLTSIVAIMAVFTLAVCFVMIGAASVEMKSKLGIDNAGIALMGFLFFLTCMIVQLLVGPMVDKFGHKPLAIVGFLVVSASIFLLAFAASFAWAIIAAILLGMGAICCNTVGNTLLPVVLFDGKEPARASNFGNAFVGLGFALPPLLIGVLMTDVGLSYAATLSIIAAVILVFAFCSMASTYPQVSTGFELSRAVKLLAKPMVLIAALALVCYIGLESTMNIWIRTLMTELFGADLEAVDNAVIARNAGLVLTGFALAMAVGRFITSTIKNLSQRGPKIIAAMSLVSVISIVVMCVTQSPVVAILAVLVTGLAFAPMFPTIVGVTFSKFDAGLYGSIFGIIFSVGLLGPTFLPFVIGKLSVGRTIQQTLPIAAVVAGVLLVIALIMNTAAKSKQQ
jgi:FHS family glucose/mannose:H+ symporter-like MFS transporter